MGASSKLPNLSGTVVDNGCIKLVKFIGAGAFGKVYKARVVASPTSFYAVKCLWRPTLDSKEARFADKELVLHRRVSSHPNVLTFYGQFMDPTYVFIVTDLSVGGDMAGAILDGTYRRKSELIKSTFASLVDGVQHCHSRGVFHRDLKPENILVDAGGLHPLIADFGLASTSKVSQEVGCGSSAYMCPESFKSVSSSYCPANSDMWALAIILINMVTSVTPWSAAESHDTRWKSFVADPEFLREILPISRSLNNLLQRCLSLNPADRLTLSQLRDEVLSLPDLFMSDIDLEKASPRTRRAAANLDAPARRVAAYSPTDFSGLSAPHSGSSSSGSGYSTLDALEAEMNRLINLPAPAGLAPPALVPPPAHVPAAGGSLLTVPTPALIPGTSTRKVPPPVASSAATTPSPLALVVELPPASSDQHPLPSSPKDSKFKRFIRRLPRVWRKVQI
ncbi:kinase-like domain-containing protein [Mycena vitilis]|nr:kinase-like domain-containing protein [Mycena vitilis]